MALIDIFQESRSQLEGKQVQQVIGFAGDGRLRDGSEASIEFRDYLQAAPMEWVKQYADQCITSPFTDSGLALQDIVNELGRRIKFSVEPGRYRGTTGEPGNDGIWRSESGHVLVVEVKTTDAYTINLETIANYRISLADQNRIALGSSSTLIVVGRQDTGSLEAQIRGSQQAWDTRIVGLDRLVRLANLATDEFERPDLDRITSVLMPQEFTRVDGILDLVFFAAEESSAHQDNSEQLEVEEREPRQIEFHRTWAKRWLSKAGACLDRSMDRPRLPVSFQGAMGMVTKRVTGSDTTRRKRRNCSERPKGTSPSVTVHRISCFWSQ